MPNPSGKINNQPVYFDFAEENQAKNTVFLLLDSLGNFSENPKEYSVFLKMQNQFYKHQSFTLAYLDLSPADSRILQNRVPGINLLQLFDVFDSKDQNKIAEFLFEKAKFYERASDLDKALLLYGILIDDNFIPVLENTDPNYIRAKNQIDRIQGNHGFDSSRAAFLLSQTLKNIFDLRQLFPMVLGMSLSRGAQFWCVKNIGPRLQSFVRNPFLSRLIVGTPAYLLEVPTIALGTRFLMQHSGEHLSTSWGDDVLAMGITIGFMKTGYNGSQYVFDRRLSFNPYLKSSYSVAKTIPYAKLSVGRVVVGQTGMYFSLLGAHKTEELFGLKPEEAGKNIWAETLVSHVQFSGTGAMISLLTPGKWNKKSMRQEALLGWHKPYFKHIYRDVPLTEKLPYFELYVDHIFQSFNIPVQDHKKRSNIYTALASYAPTNEPLYRLTTRLTELHRAELGEQNNIKLNQILDSGPRAIQVLFQSILEQSHMDVHYLIHIAPKPKLLVDGGVYESIPEVDMRPFVRPVYSAKSSGTESSENPFRLRRELIKNYQEMDLIFVKINEALEQLNQITDPTQREREHKRLVSENAKALEVHSVRIQELYEKIAHLYLRDRQAIIDEAFDTRIQRLRREPGKEFYVGKAQFPATELNNADSSQMLFDTVLAFNQKYFREKLVELRKADLNSRIAQASTPAELTVREKLQRELEILERDGIGLVEKDMRVSLLFFMDLLQGGQESNLRSMSEIVEAYPQALVDYLHSQGWYFEKKEGTTYQQVDFAKGVPSDLIGYRIRNKSKSYQGKENVGLIVNSLSLTPIVRMEYVDSVRVEGLERNAHLLLRKELTAKAEYLQKQGFRGVHSAPLNQEDIAPYMNKLIPGARNLSPHQLMRGLLNLSRYPRAVRYLMEAQEDLGLNTADALTLPLLTGDQEASNLVYSSLMAAEPKASVVRLQTYLEMFERPFHDLGRINGFGKGAALTHLRFWLAEAQKEESVFRPAQILTKIQAHYKRSHRILRIAARTCEKDRIEGVVPDQYFAFALEDFGETLSRGRVDERTGKRIQYSDELSLLSIDINDMKAFLESHPVKGSVDSEYFRIPQTFFDALKEHGFLKEEIHTSKDGFKRKKVTRHYVMTAKGDEIFIALPRKNLQGEAVSPVDVLETVRALMKKEFGLDSFPELFKRPEGRRFAFMVPQKAGPPQLEWSIQSSHKNPKARVIKTTLSFSASYYEGIRISDLVPDVNLYMARGLEKLDAPKKTAVKRRVQALEIGDLESLESADHTKGGTSFIPVDPLSTPIPREILNSSLPAETD